MPTPTPDPSDDRQRLYQLLGRKEERIANLESENTSLRDQLNDALAKCNPVPSSARADQLFENSVEAQLAALQTNYADLQNRYDALKSKQDWAEDRVRKADKKYEAAKESAKQWKAYIDKKLDQQGRSRAERGAATPEMPPEVLRVSDADATRRTRVRRNDSGEGGGDVELPDAAGGIVNQRQSRAMEKNPLHISSAGPGSSPPPSGQQAGRVTSSQTTEFEQSYPPENAVNQDQHSSSDGEIEIVSERNLKRKRSGSRAAMPPPVRIKQEPASPQRPGSEERPLEIKSEDYSSPSAERGPLIRTQTSDLDAMVGGALQTPRRKRLQRTMGTRAVSEEVAKAAFRPPRMVARNSSSLSDGDVAEMDERLLGLRDENEENADHEARKQSLHTTATTAPQRPPGRARGALRQLSPNVPTPPKSKTPTNKSKTPTDRSSAKKTAYLAEDGDEETSQVTPERLAREIPSGSRPANKRLDGLLEQPDLDVHRPLQRDTRTPNVRKHLTRAQELANPQLPSPAPTTSATTTPDHPKTSNITPTTKERRPARPPPAPKTPQPPLRGKPPTGLHLSDFKPNPAFTETGFATADSVRGRAAKSCLPGCTRPCCAIFLTLARTGGLPETKLTRDQILEKYLGPTHQQVMAGFTPEKRQDTWYRAQAFEASSKYGKHKVQWERAKSPPGYWRTGMPSTQEEEEDRRAAEERVRERVEERWVEALRGGRWVFRDEA